MDLITAADPESRSADPVVANVARLQALFPDAVAEGQVDFDALRQLLGAAVADGDEKYGLNWHGKRAARRLALTPSAGTLRPCPNESVDWDTTQNLMLEGDNLEVLKLLSKSYAGKVKLIYIDPPYNTGKDFIYPDNYQDGVKNYLRLTGQVDGNGHKLSTNTESSGRFHTVWLNMMYPRLKIARDLLTEDGVIMISIDDGEVNLIKSMASEIFGEENFLSVLIWNKQHSQQQGIFKKYHEYIITYAKNSEQITAISGGSGEIDAGALKKVTRGNPASDFTFPAGVRFDAPDGTEIAGTFGNAEEVTVVSGQFICRDGKTAQNVTLRAGWTQKNQMESYFAGKETYDTRGQYIIEFYFNSTGKLKCRKVRGKITPPSLLPQYGMVSKQTRDLSDLLGDTVFPNPKPVDMMKDFISWFCGERDIVLDFFAGSGTTGHAVMSQCADDESSLRYIMVQFPEVFDIDDRSQETAAKYCANLGKPHNLAEITKERLRLAGEKVKDETPSFSGDTGFRVFKLDSSNIKAWDPQPADLEQALLDHVENIKPDRSEDDLLYEVLLKQGLDLCAPIERREIAGQTVSVVAGGALMACLSPQIDGGAVEDLALGIVAWRNELGNPADTRALFRDNAFADDVAKTNLTEILRQYGIRDVRSI